MQEQQNIRRSFVDGGWAGGVADRIDVNDPRTRQRVAGVALADEALIDAAVGAAQRAVAHARAQAPFERAAILSGTAAGIERRREQFVNTIVAEAGKPITLADAEVARAIITFTAAAEAARHVISEVLDVEGFAPGRGHVGFMRRFPVGVVYGITPFNFPLNLVAHKVAPAIASGNTIVIKPSPKTPLSALLLAEVMAEAGAAKGTVNVLVAPNDLAGRPIDDARVKHVSFTGSVPVGWSIKRQAAAGQKRVTLELGGNAGVIVHDDADLPAAIPLIAAGAFGYAGQSCISVQRIALHAPIYDRFRDEFVRHVCEHIHAGDPRDRRTLVGPLIDDAAVSRVRKLLVDATRGGAKMLCGGRFDGNVLEPTVLESVDPKLDVCRTEAFAPVCTLHRYDGFDDAVRFVNDSEYGLQAGVFTRDIDRAWRAFETMEVGGVMINQVPTFRVETMPYGGTKSSGFGREGIRWAMEEMTEPRVMIVRVGG